jgi:hypothetical protein
MAVTGAFRQGGYCSHGGGAAIPNLPPLGFLYVADVTNVVRKDNGPHENKIAVERPYAAEAVQGNGRI